MNTAIVARSVCYSYFKKWFPTSEQADYNGDQANMTKILRENDSKRVYYIGKHTKITHEWTDDQEEAMREVLVAKFKYCEGFRKTLINTGDKSLKEDTHHPVFGWNR